MFVKFFCEIMGYLKRMVLAKNEVEDFLLPANIPV